MLEHLSAGNTRGRPFKTSDGMECTCANVRCGKKRKELNFEVLATSMNCSVHVAPSYFVPNQQQQPACSMGKAGSRHHPRPLCSSAVSRKMLNDASCKTSIYQNPFLIFMLIFHVPFKCNHYAIPIRLTMHMYSSASPAPQGEAADRRH
jgi:hypothetical protein